MSAGVGLLVGSEFKIAGAASTTPTTAPGAVNNNPGLHITGTGAGVFIGVAAIVLVSLWFLPVLQTARASGKVRRSKLRMIEAFVKARGNSLSEPEFAALLTGLETSADGQQPAADAQTSGLQGLTGALIALTTLTLVGFALAVALLSSSTDAGDLRKTIITALLSILASITGFYFGARTAQQSAAQQAQSTSGSAPVLSSAPPPLTAIVGQPYTCTFDATGTPSPSYSLAGAPEWLRIDASTGTVSGKPPSGTTSFTYTVIASNATGSTSAGPFTVTVTPAGAP